MTTENGSQSFKLTWKGGFSYLTYLLKEFTVTLNEKDVHVQTHSKVLGIIPSGTKKQTLLYTDIQKIAIGNYINWFQLLFAVLFSAFTALLLINGSGIRWVGLIASIVFFWLSFRSKQLILTNRTGATLRILSTSKATVEALLQRLAQQLDYTKPGQVVVVREGKAKTAIIASCAALVITGTTIFSVTMNENQQYITFVQNSSFAETGYKLKDIVEHPTYFSNVSWKNVSFDGASDLDHYVMYEGTFSESGVKVLARAVFQVHGSANFDVVEFNIDGEQFEPATTEWTLFAAHIVDKMKGGSPSVATSKPEPTEDKTSKAKGDLNNDIEKQESPTPEKTNSAVEMPSEQLKTDEAPVRATNSITLSNFSKWSPSAADLSLPLKLDGESIDLLIGMDSPNGVKVLAISQSFQQGWQLPLDAPQDASSPFDDFGELRKGFSLYVQEYDFGNDSVPEVVLVASDGLLETYIWVYSYNYIFSEQSTSPLEQIWYGEGQSDVVLEGDKISLPFGSQGLFDEYLFRNNTFIKQ
ncbi:hypothetical protein KQI74_12895 [Paenibacillus barcinonensis]|uniref:hypothetical protein n=1 Tax=Paenibacillus barcinonensis TaxID=198119 RepID=UPI001C101F45|nr:hypothetical protein [Paenibacillus barcinonensis]MBU5353189.1 hypothetical protein [Paenibacillus barcinonensis]